jgi:hypothetical protein
MAVQFSNILVHTTGRLDLVLVNRIPGPAQAACTA